MVGLDNQIAVFSGYMISYTMGNANSSLAQSDLTSYANDLLLSMRLEVLLTLVKAPIVESRKHVPGDIFSRHLHNGCLRTLDEDELFIFETTGSREDQYIMATFEGKFLIRCAEWKTLHGYVQNRLSFSNGRAIAPLVQVSALEMLIRSLTFWSTHPEHVRDVLLLTSVERWVHALARSRLSLEFFKSVRRWALRLVPGFIDSSTHQSSKGTRHDFTEGPGFNSSVSFQWTPLGSDRITNWHEMIMTVALVQYSTRFVRLPKHDGDHGVLGRLARIMEPWDLWIELLAAYGSRYNRTSLFVRMVSLAIPKPKVGEEDPPDHRAVRYRVTCYKTSVHHEPLSSVDLHPSIELYDGPVFEPRKAHWHLRAEALEQKKVDVLIDAVRQSTELNEDQKDHMIEGIKAFETRDPQI
jgi:hypothetical protein